jgi:hypothetical protein
VCFYLTDLASTSLTPHLACTLLARLAQGFLSTLCLHQGPSCPWAFAQAVLSTSSALPSLWMQVLLTYVSPF